MLLLLFANKRKILLIKIFFEIFNISKYCIDDKYLHCSFEQFKANLHFHLLPTRETELKLIYFNQAISDRLNTKGIEDCFSNIRLTGMSPSIGN